MSVLSPQKIALMVLFLTHTLLAQNPFLYKNDQELMETVKTIMPSTSIKKVMRTEMSDLLVVLLANEEIVYVYPPKKLIFIGEIYSKDGVSLSEMHLKKIGAQTLQGTQEGVLDISVLFNVSTRIKESKHPYGFIIFTDPDCPYCQELDRFLARKRVRVDHVYTPLDSLHPNARAKAIKTVMEKNKLVEKEAIKRIQEGENIATGLGIKGTPLLIVYEVETNKPINAISGANVNALDVYLKGADE